MNVDQQHQPRTEDEPLYAWSTFQLCGGVEGSGPSGTCRAEHTARTCLEAALRATATHSGAYSWGQLSRVSADVGLPFHLWARDPVAWAEPGPSKTVTWRPGAAPHPQ
ncbi:MULTISPECIES: hypothetical protein [Streptomyces]|uniref:Uncharacterized protein n=1 Tax=Streptomyces violaceusniger (strain Tu 4113) TaxID=653045 RepID=G2NUJ9_STRV4|nr:hypothetical protein [Streptomyces violaceusniger]AEM84598.1 hypothetical protein Strvi_5058 [Streptomyces violaceusniger Tu 4113]